MQGFGTHLNGPWYETDDGAISTRGWTRVSLLGLRQVAPDLSGCQGQFIVDWNHVMFEKASDATMFRLRRQV